MKIKKFRRDVERGLLAVLDSDLFFLAVILGCLAVLSVILRS